MLYFIHFVISNYVQVTKNTSYQFENSNDYSNQKYHENDKHFVKLFFISYMLLD